MPLMCGLPAHVLPDRVSDELVIRQPAVRHQVIGVVLGSDTCSGRDEANEVAWLAVIDHRGADPVGLSVLDPGHHRLPPGATAHAQPVALVLVLLFPAEVRLICLDRTLELLQLQHRPRLADPVSQVPRALLRDTEVPMQLHRRHPLQGGEHQVQRDRPHLVAEVGGLHHCADLHAEPLRAPLLTAPVRHRLVSGAGLDVVRTAVRAGRPPVRPALLSEPLLRLLVVREQTHQLGEAQSLPECLAWSFHGDYRIVPKSRSVKGA